MYAAEMRLRRKVKKNKNDIFRGQNCYYLQKHEKDNCGSWAL